MFDKCIENYNLSFYNSQINGQLYLDYDKKVLNAIYNFISNLDTYSKFDRLRFLENNLESDNFIKKYNYKIAAEDFRLLTINYKKISDYISEDKTYKEYMKNFTTYKNMRFSKMLGLIGDYGCNPAKVFIVSLILLFIFGLVYAIAIYNSSFEKLAFIENNKILEAIKNGIYFSGITFLTIGYGDISPPNMIIGTLVLIEGFLGLFLMSFFTVAIVKKIIR